MSDDMVELVVIDVERPGFERLSSDSGPEKQLEYV